jgi:hypothetical protein
VTAATESRTTAAIIFCAIVVCTIVVPVDALRHVYNIVCQPRILEAEIKVTQDWKPK